MKTNSLCKKDEDLRSVNSSGDTSIAKGSTCTEQISLVNGETHVDTLRGSGYGEDK